MQIEPQLSQKSSNSVQEFIDLNDNYEDHNNFAQAYKEHHKQGEFYDELDEIGIDLRFNEMDEDRIAENIQFFIKELGGVKRLQGHDIYVITETAEKSLKDLKKNLKNENPSFPFVKYLLGKWDVLNNNIIPIIQTQQENKSILYEALIILVFLTEPLNHEMLQDFKYKDDVIKQYESYKVIFSQENFVQTLVTELGYCVQKKPEERNQYENDIIELILYIIRNSLAYKTYRDNFENQGILIKIFELYAKDFGIFQAIVYLSNEFNEKTKNLCYLLLEIIYLIISKVKINQIFSQVEEQQQFRRLRLIEKLKESQRQKICYSSRHSNFGAIFQIKKNNKTIGIASNPKQIKQINSMYNNKHIKNKIQKPKTRSKVPFKNTDYQMNKQKIQLPTNIKNCIQIFIIDLLEHSFISMVETNYNEFYSDEKSKIRIDENKIFVDFLTFGLKIALIRFKNKQKSNWFLSALQLNIIDFVFNKLQDALENEKSQQNYHFIFSALEFFVMILKSIKYIHNQKDENSQQNKKILEALIFSKDLSKTIKKSLIMFKKVPKNPANQSLIQIIDLYFQMLSNYSLNKVFTVMQHQKDDQVPEWEDVGEMHNFKKDMKLKEKRFTYLTELGLFLDFEIVQVHLEYLKDESFALRSQDFKEAIFSFIRRIIEDLHASWVFYQIDFLEIFHQFTISKDPIINMDSVCLEIKKIAKQIFHEVRQAQKRNSLFMVEMLFRFQNFSVKENILSNYSGIRPELRVEEINLELSVDENKLQNQQQQNDSFIVDDDQIEKEKQKSTMEILNENLNKDIVDNVQIKDYQNLIFKEEKNEKRKIKICKRLIKKKLACKEQVGKIKKPLENSGKKSVKFIKQIENDDEILINQDNSSDDSISLEIVDDDIPIINNTNNYQDEKIVESRNNSYFNVQEIQNNTNNQNENKEQKKIENSDQKIKIKDMDQKINVDDNKKELNVKNIDQNKNNTQEEDDDEEDDFVVLRKRVSHTKI